MIVVDPKQLRAVIKLKRIKGWFNKALVIISLEGMGV